MKNLFKAFNMKYSTNVYIYGVIYYNEVSIGYGQKQQIYLSFAYIIVTHYIVLSMYLSVCTWLSGSEVVKCYIFIIRIFFSKEKAFGAFAVCDLSKVEKRKIETWRITNRFLHM